MAKTVPPSRHLPGTDAGVLREAQALAGSSLHKPIYTAGWGEHDTRSGNRRESLHAEQTGPQAFKTKGKR